jgi:hypothetical protein
MKTLVAAAEKELAAAESAHEVLVQEAAVALTASMEANVAVAEKLKEVQTLKSAIEVFSGEKVSTPEPVVEEKKEEDRTPKPVNPYAHTYCQGCDSHGTMLPGQHGLWTCSSCKNQSRT